MKIADRGLSGTAVFLFAILVTGYMETLRMTAFYAFGWQWTWVWGFIALVVSAALCLRLYKTSRVTSFTAGVIVTIFIALAGASETGNFSGSMSKLFSTGIGLSGPWYNSLTHFNRGLLGSGVICSYAVMVFLIVRLILERNTASEVFALGSALSVTAMVVSDRGILIYMALNFVFALGLYGCLNLVELNNNYRVRNVAGSGINGGLWVSVLVLFVAAGVFMVILLPVVDSGAKVLPSLGQRLVSVLPGRNTDSGTELWGRLQSFDFEGDLSLDRRPIFMVKSEQPFYWRGESSDLYTGTGWKNTMLLRGVSDDDFSNHLPGAVLPMQKKEAAFSFLPGKGSEIIYSPGIPASVSIPASGLAADDGGNFYKRDGFGSPYKVISYIHDFDPDILKKLSGPYPPEIRKKYLQLPGIPDRVRQLAGRLASSADTPYQKAKTIEHYLASNYPYNLKVTSPPEGRDVVDYFLFDLKRGYCTYHSTAMTVMLRSIGIPARWVTGFTPGTYDQKMDAYVVTMANAHAWVEVYIPGAGWVSFDPTAAEPIPSTEKQKLEQKDSGTKDDTTPIFPETSPAVSKVNKGSYGTTSFAAQTYLVIIVLVGAAVLGLKKLSGSKLKPEIDTVEQLYCDFLKLIGEKGYYKKRNQTPMEFAGELVRRNGFAEESNEIMYVTNAYLRHRFSLEKLTAVEIEELTQVLEELNRKWGPKRRD